MYGYGAPNPYPHSSNPFMSNPLLMLMMSMGNQDFNPDEGNGILHPVYLSPLAMHKLEQSVPPFEDPDLLDAKQGNIYCTKGATISCGDSGKKIETAKGLKELQIPEKISCFVGCAS